MKKILQSSFFRAVAAIAVGILLIKFPDNTVRGITIAIGLLFLVSGLVSVLTYWIARRHLSEYKIYDAEGREVTNEMPAFPIVGIGSMLLGGSLALMPSTFVSALMYVIGAILILGAINQFFSLIAARRYARLPFLYWICPTLILLAGAYLLIKPLQPLSMAMYVMGWVTLFYGIVEAVNTLLLYRHRRQWEKENEVVISEETILP